MKGFLKWNLFVFANLKDPMNNNPLVCKICRREIRLEGDYINSPVLLNSAWKKCLTYFNLQNTQEKIYMCDKCMSIALNRKVDIKDLKECLISTNWLCNL